MIGPIRPCVRAEDGNYCQRGAKPGADIQLRLDGQAVANLSLFLASHLAGPFFQGF